MKTLAQLILIALAAVAVSHPHPVAAQDDNPWKSRKICTFCMPFMGDAVGTHGSGLITAILTAAFKKERIDLRHKALPYTRCLAELKSGMSDCTLELKGYKRTGLQAKAVMALYDLSAAFLRTTKWEGVKSLKDKRVAFVHGFDLQQLLDVNIMPHMVYDLSSAYHLLDRGRVDYVLDDGWLLKDALYDSRLPGSGFAFAAIKSFEVQPVFTDTPSGRHYRDVYDWRIKEMLLDGELAEILEEHGLGKEYVNRVRKANGL